MTRHTSAITIRDALSGDLAAICRLVDSPEEMCLAFPGGRFPLSEKQLRRLAEQRSDLTVAVDSGEVVGFADLYGVLTGHWAFIGNLIVAPSHRKSGIGSRLMEHMLDRVFDVHGLPMARISVFEHNTSARRLYERMGFRRYADERRRDWQERTVTLLHMQLGR
jgi:ribosomal protein S18 acetylase RimI-like enzyme